MTLALNISVQRVREQASSLWGTETATSWHSRKFRCFWWRAWRRINNWWSIGVEVMKGVGFHPGRQPLCHLLPWSSRPFRRFSMPFPQSASYDCSPLPRSCRVSCRVWLLPEMKFGVMSLQNESAASPSGINDNDSLCASSLLRDFQSGCSDDFATEVLKKLYFYHSGQRKIHYKCFCFLLYWCIIFSRLRELLHFSVSSEDDMFTVSGNKFLSVFQLKYPSGDSCQWLRRRAADWTLQRPNEPRVRYSSPYDSVQEYIWLRPSVQAFENTFYSSATALYLDQNCYRKPDRFRSVFSWRHCCLGRTCQRRFSRLGFLTLMLVSCEYDQAHTVSGTLFCQ